MNIFFEIIIGGCARITTIGWSIKFDALKNAIQPKPTSESFYDWISAMKTVNDWILWIRRNLILIKYELNPQMCQFVKDNIYHFSVNLRKCDLLTKSATIYDNILSQD